MKKMISLLFLVSLVACGSIEQKASPRLKGGAVVSPEPRAAEVGAQVLRDGGNAVDASVATFFALAVTFPQAGNLGGGGFMLISRGKEVEALDYREKAPLSAHRDLYLDGKGSVVPGLSLKTHLASGVPGSVRGMWEAHRRFGSLSWRRLLAPAIRLAHEGIRLTKKEADRFSRGPDHGNFRKHFRGKGGELFLQRDLAKTLSRIAEQGPDGFYRGETAKLIVTEMKRGNGQITREDLESYRAIWRKPVHGTYRGRDVYSMCPPSSGGIAVVQILNMVEGFPVLDHNSAQYLHLLAEIEKQVFADRSVHLGDSDFVSVPSFLTSKTYAQKRADHISLDRKTAPKSISHGRGESEETTHFSVVDRWGNGVSNTTTLNGSFGSGIVVDGAGFLLNNEMDDFSSKPGVPNMFGVTGGEANAIAAGKRMLSSMSPTFVFQEGKLWLVLGSPGGPTIITTVAQVILNRIDHGMSLSEAVAAPRFHHQWPPRKAGDDSIRIEKEIRVESLERWYTFDVRRIGDVQAIEINGGGVIGVPDPRGTGTVVYE